MKVTIELGTLNDVLDIHAEIPEFTRQTSLDELNKRLSGLPHLILIAWVNGKKAGYKLGYQLSNTVFYSWLGGVIPQYRKCGIANTLRQYQENWAQQAGYTAIEVKSMNRFPNMLRLLIANGYQIVGYEPKNTKTDGKILFYKCLD